MSNTTQAQTKVGVFDMERMVMLMPGYRAVDSLTQLYERDSLAAENRDLQNEYQRLDSLYKLDSAAHKNQTILDMQKKNMQQIAFQLIYWQQIAQNKLENKRGMLAQPLYEKVFGAYKKVVEARKYTLILKPEAIEMLSTGVDNLFIPVAAELKVALPQEFGGGQQQAEPAGDRPATKPAAGGAKPATPAKRG